MVHRCHDDPRGYLGRRGVHNAGGWPVHGFSQSSGIHEVWNFWIVYPLGAWLLVLAAHGWFVYGNKPISESEIKREVERQARTLR